jgi:MscS family membrane protein
MRWFDRRRTFLHLAGWILVAAVLLAQHARAADATRALAPLDTSSPRATLTGFLATMDEALRLTRDHFLKSWTMDAQVLSRVRDLDASAYRTLDVSNVPPDAQTEVSRDAASYLYEVLSRIELPPEGEIPGKGAFEEGKKNVKWTIPNTEITLARADEGPRAGQFLFNPETVARAREFYDRTRDLPHVREAPLKNVVERRANMGGFLIPPRVIEHLPGWAKQPVLGQGMWKWCILAVAIIAGFAAVFGIHRLARANLSAHGFGTQLRRLATPVSLLLLAQFLPYLTSSVLMADGELAEGLILAAGAVSYLAGAWAVWIAAATVAELVISSPRIGDQSLDAHMLRLAARVVGIFSAVALLFHGANQIGLPIYGVIAGVGVGGLAIALAARTTLEDFLGSINLYVDQPVRVGDFCRYGEDPSAGWLRIGSVESIGLRSTRIRGIDRTITTIPNSDFARMHIVNMTSRDRMLLKANLHLRYDTTPEQLRLVLEELRALLREHPRVTDVPARVRFIGIGEYSLDLEIFAYVDTSDPDEFLVIQEDLNLRIMQVVEEAGTGLALPSRTIYHTRDGGLGLQRLEKAEA